MLFLSSLRLGFLFSNTLLNFFPPLRSAKMNPSTRRFFFFSLHPTSQRFFLPFHFKLSTQLYIPNLLYPPTSDARQDPHRFLRQPKTDTDQLTFVFLLADECYHPPFHIPVSLHCAQHKRNPRLRRFFLFPPPHLT